MQKIVMFGMIVGSSLGSYFPVLWGGNLFSLSSIFWGAIGGLVGVWMGYKIGSYFS